MSDENRPDPELEALLEYLKRNRGFDFTGCTGGAAHREVVLEATNRRGRTIRCKVNCTPLHGQFGEATGAFLVVEEG